MKPSPYLTTLRADIDTLRAPGGYLNAGLPNYDHLFGRDACVSALQLLEYDPTIARATLEVLAKFRGKRRLFWREEYPGKILHEHFPGGFRQIVQLLWRNSNRLALVEILLFWRFPYYGSVDAGAWFLILLHHYVRVTGDHKFAHRMWPTVRGIINWLSKHGVSRQTGLVGYSSHYVFGIRNQSWKDASADAIAPPVAMVEVQGYYYYALNLAADLADEVMADPALATDWRTRAAVLKAAFDRAFVPTNGQFPMAVDGFGKPYKSATSNPGHLLFTGILDETTAKAVAARLMAPDFWTPYGIRTESTAEPSFRVISYQNGSVWPFDNWVIAQGMAKIGLTRETERIRDALVRVYDDLERIPELYCVTTDGQLHESNDACPVQAWSSGALIHMLTDSAPL